MGLLGSFLGTDQKKDLQGAKQQADAQLGQGYDKAYGDYSNAITGFDQYAQSGQKNQKFYDDLQGLNGREAQAAAQEVYQSDPFAQNALGQSENAMTRYGNARGYGAGKFALAGQRVANDAYGAWKGTYATGAGQGLQAATQQGNAMQGRGDLSYGYGATKAGNEINYGNALAASRSTGVNNLLNAAGTAAKAAAAFSDIRLKRDIERIGTTPAGLPTYKFKYISGDNEHIGVMAHEARELFPDAVFEAPNGFLMVDYARIG